MSVLSFEMYYYNELLDEVWTEMRKAREKGQLRHVMKRK